MRTSGTLMNLAAAVALALAAASLWHAYTVRFSDEAEHAAPVEPGPGEVGPAPPVAPASAAAAGLVAKVIETPAVSPEAVAMKVPAPPMPAPSMPVQASETPLESAPVPARISLRDPRQIPEPSPAPPVTVPVTVAHSVSTVTPPERQAALPRALVDRRLLIVEERTPAAQFPKAEPVIRTSTSLLRDARQMSPSLVLAPAPGSIAATESAAASAAPAACGAHSIVTEALDGGMMRVVITAPCRANQDVQLAYGGANLIRRFDPEGRLDYMLDCFAGATSELTVTFADGASERRPVVAGDLDRLSKVAVIWNAPVNLDLHAFEYSAAFGRAGHVWERAASTPVAAREIMLGGRRGRGYLSTIDDGRSIGDKLEVYTFLHHDEQSSGVVAMGLDYATRGEMPAGMTCGSGTFAEVRYQVVTLGRRGQIARENGILSAAPCGARIGAQVRFDPLLLPALRMQQ